MIGRHSVGSLWGLQVQGLGLNVFNFFLVPSRNLYGLNMIPVVLVVGLDF